MFGVYATAGFLVWRVVTFFVPTFMAVPLIGLKSSHRDSIYHRLHRVVGHGVRSGRGARGGIAYKPKQVAATSRSTGTIKSGVKFVVKSPRGDGASKPR